ncbi:MAG: 16S rRNA (cytosine(1402)-N(4))-methyltransferase RsmH [Flavobacteriales bacterium]|nr:16S rRNA (cytosine(1402)-N(4))-methyltransferase RsmH [Flavobacteriales bacterium]
MAHEYHDPVLLQACIEGLNISPAGVYVDVTFGGGGHSKAILQRLGPKGRLIAFDRDADAWKNALDDPRFTLVRSDFRWIKNHLRFHEALPIDGLLADLGVSSHQFDEADRGFSFRNDGPLDMRMDRRAKRTAAQLLASVDEAELARILRTYGEVDDAKRVANKIIAEQRAGALRTTHELAQVLQPFTRGHGKDKLLPQVFQALRIAVNDELGSLEKLLAHAAAIIKPGGVLAIISYHSLEDRMVKNWMRSGSVDGTQDKDVFGNMKRPFSPSTGKAIAPTEEEINRNPRARSARLRTATRT